MKRVIYALAAALLLTGLPQDAEALQEGVLQHVAEVHVKPGQEQLFEAAQRDEAGAADLPTAQQYAQRRSGYIRAGGGDPAPAPRHARALGPARGLPLHLHGPGPARRPAHRRRR